MWAGGSAMGRFSVGAPPLPRPHVEPHGGG